MCLCLTKLGKVMTDNRDVCCALCLANHHCNVRLAESTLLTQVAQYVSHHDFIEHRVHTCF